MKKKTVLKENYFEFLKNKLKSLISKPENYVYFSLVLIAFGIYWYETNLNKALEIVMLFFTSCSVIFFIIELLATIIKRKAEINNLVTEFCLMLLFIVLSIIFYDDLYFETLKLFAIYSFVTIVIFSFINKIRHWLNL